MSYMSIVYKFDVLAALKEKGYSQNRIRVEKLIGQSYLTQLRHSELVSWKTIETICHLLECKPGDLLDYVPDNESATENGTTEGGSSDE